MSHYYIYTLIPIVLTIFWAIISKLRLKDWYNAFFVLAAGVTLLLNGYAVYHMICDREVPMWLLLMQLLLSPLVVPQAYMYFCRQLGTRGSIGVKIAHFALLAFLLVPSLNIDIHPAQEAAMHDPIEFMHFNIFSHGVRVYSITMPSLIILLQAIITILRIPVVVSSLNAYDLKFSTAGKFFIFWWILAISFCVGSSLVEMETLKQPNATMIYFASYTFLCSFIFAQIALGYDLHPLQTTDDDEVENIDAYIEATKELAERARRLFMEEKLYLRQGIVTDDVVRMLGTNRTYFTRMMRSEFKMSFNEFVTSERIAYSKHLLTSTDKTLEEVAMDSGFANASAYCRVFKRITSTSPDVWRKDHKEDREDETENA